MRLSRTQIVFRAPPRADVLLFDGTNRELLEQTVLHNISHSTLETRFERVYVAPLVIFNMLMAAPGMHWRYILHFGHILRRIRGELYTLYLYACVAAIQPKVVLTFIDNSIHFQLVSRRYKEAGFFAIQNGVRSEFNLAHDLVPAPHPAHRISMPFLFCFGEYERVMYPRFGHSVDHFEAVGSIKAGYYLNMMRRKKPDEEFDICVASQWVDDVMIGTAYPEIKHSLEAMDSLIGRYLTERPWLSICVALRGGHPLEKAYFQSRYGTRATIVERATDGYSSYFAVDKSRVTILLDSTIGREAYGWGKRVLFCNFTGHDMYETATHDWCHISQIDYRPFSEKLDFLLQMTDAHFLDSTAVNRAFLMRNNPERPPHCVIRERIMQELALHQK